MNGSAWCAMFVSYCAYQAGVLDNLVPKYAWCPSGMTWYKDRGKYHKRSSGYSPKCGDIIFFYNDELGRVAHTGIVIGGDEKYVTTIEGNTSLDRVQKCTYTLTNSRIDGYGDNGGTPIKPVVPPTQQEIDRVLRDYYREFLDTCGLVLPDEKIVLNQEAEILFPPNAKVLVEASAESTIFENTANSPFGAVFNVTDGIAMSGEIALTDFITLSVEGVENMQNIMDLVLNLNVSLDTGTSAVDIGTRLDTSGNWLYVAYAIKKEVEIVAGFPHVEFIFKVTYCQRIEGSDGTSLLDPVFEFVKTHQKELDTVVTIFTVIALVLVFLAALSAAGGWAALGSAIANILSNLARVLA